MANYSTPAQAYCDVVRGVLLTGEKVEGRGGGMREVIGHSFTVRQPDRIWDIHDVPGRGLNPTIGALEALQLLGQVSLPEVHTDRVKVFKNWLDDGVFLGAYGQRVHGQLAKLTRSLAMPGSRQAVLSIYDSTRDLLVDSKDVPCTLTLQFFIRGGKVILRTSMRSNDVWRGLPYDMVQFITLQAAVAAHFDLEIGQYQHTVGSLHLYEADVEKAMDLDLWEDGGDDPSPLGQQRLFNPGSIADASSWARRSLVEPGPPWRVLGETHYQYSLREAIIKKEHR